MVKLTSELITQAGQCTNAIRDRELDLRGFKIPSIENLGSTLDQFDTIDFSDNDIRKLDGFPLLRRLKCLLLNNNRITRIVDHLETMLPNLESLILTNNNVQELGDVDCLSGIKNLHTVSLLRNPVTAQRHYRLYVIHKLPQLKILDFQKIKQKEREDAVILFKGKKGIQLVREIGKRVNTFEPGAALPAGSKSTAEQGDIIGASPAILGAPLKRDIETIKAAISAATTLEEVERLNRILQSGLVPERGRGGGNPLTTGNGVPHNKQDTTEDESEMET